MEAPVRFFSFAALLFVFASLNTPHALYLSVLEVTHESTTTVITVKVFTDDLQNAIRNFDRRYSHQPDDQFIESNKQLILDYFRKNLVLTINQQSQTLKIQEFKKENDAYFIFFQVDSPAKWKDFQIKAPYFTEIFPDQSNILTLIHGREKYFARLNKIMPSYETTFY